MPQQRNIEPEDFEMLLAWLSPDRDAAGRLYEQIRERLIKIFVARGSSEADFLADETIDRVIGKAKELKAGFVGEDPFVYFGGVARLVYYESLRRERKTQQSLGSLDGNHKPARSPEGQCLDGCLKTLTNEQESLFLEYYESEKTGRGDCRHDLAERFGMDGNALRVKVYRIKIALQECVKRCVEKILLICVIN